MPIRTHMQPKVVENVCRRIIEKQPGLPKNRQDLIEPKISANDPFCVPRFCNVGRPAEDLLVKRHYGDVKVRWHVPGHSSRQYCVMRIGNPLQNA